MAHQFIAVEGPIGVGKTTLAKRLAESLGASLVHDAPDANPYLESFYRTPKQHAFHTQLHFLLARLDLMAAQLPTAAAPVVADFLLAKDPLFAKINLDETEYWMYSRCYAALQQTLPRPDLVIYLQAPLEVLISRIDSRGVRYEHRMDSTYLQRLTETYEAFFHSYTDSPLLIVNAKDINLADNEQDYDNLRERIASISAGRHYLNPIAAEA